MLVILYIAGSIEEDQGSPMHSSISNISNTIRTHTHTFDVTTTLKLSKTLAARIKKPVNSVPKSRRARSVVLLTPTASASDHGAISARLSNIAIAL